MQEIHDRFEICFKLAQLVLREAERIEDFLLLPLVVDADRLLEVVTDADVIDHEALVLGLSGDSIDPCDSLQQIVGDDHLVEIHHPLDRRIEAREQHVVDDENAHIAAHALVFASEGQLETLGARFVLRWVRTSR